MEYDVYYSTGGLNMIGGGADVWVNNWLELIPQHLKTESKLLIHRTRPPGHQPDCPMEVHWQGHDRKKFKELLDNARRIHILHGYYSPHVFITENKDKIHSVGIHCSVKDIMKAQFVLGLDKGFHFYMQPKWENDIKSYAKYPFWIGINDPKWNVEHDHLITIPNFYEFKHNKDVVDSNRVGYAARMETRKCPHFLEGIDSLFFTDTNHLNWWERNLNTDTSKWKVYNYKHEQLNMFMNRDWGISHSAHIYEPFGYSIFQAVDWGKIPILAHDWIPKYDYPFRASTPKEFKEQYNNICELSLQEKRDILFPLREYLKQWDNKEQWRDRLLEIYNE